MSVAVKTRLTEVTFGKNKTHLYLVPAAKAHSIEKLIEEYRVEDEELIDADDAFKYLDEAQTKAGVLIQGYRTRDNLTQVALAKLLGSSQPTVAAMESGARPIGKTVAKKLAKIFDADYRSFL